MPRPHATSTFVHRGAGHAAAVLLLTGGLLMLDHTPALPTAPDPPPASDAGFLQALRAPQPGVLGGAAQGLYAPLIGDWEGEVVDHLPDGTDRRQSVEMHFAWVLEGRAIQDLWIAPARRDRLPAESPGPGNRYGTTLRVYDPGLEAWRVSWWNPVTGVETRLVGRAVGSRIVQTGADADGRLLRWVFEEIRADRFHWRGEISEDGGLSWHCDTEFFARRQSPPEQAKEAPGARRRVSWEWLDRPGLETLDVRTTGDGVEATGTVVVGLDGAPVRARYSIQHDRRWGFRHARVELGSGDAARSLEVARDADGEWTVDGQARPDLRGCEDVDLMVTPYTNTPPLAARPLVVGGSRRLKVAWVRFPDLAVRPVEQEYTRLAEADATARYRYHNLESGFEAELTTDRDHLVVDYGPWRRR